MQVPVIASNRVGKEEFGEKNITFYGGSFVSGQKGEVLAQVAAMMGRWTRLTFYSFL